MADIAVVLKGLRQDRERLDKAIAALEIVSSVNGRRAVRSAVRKKRTISAAGRKRIVAAQRARWAKWRRTQKKAA
jgi:RNase P/RNase MRP subunit POP5